MFIKHRKLAFTLIELLAVLGIIAILIGVLIPALTMVKKMAKETQQRAQLTTIELALTAFKNDSGNYPPSSWQGIQMDYCGAQMLAEGLVGWDLRGFHPNSTWESNGGGPGGPYDPPTPSEANLKERKGPYLEVATSNAFRLEQLFNDTGTKLAPDTYVICDVFGVRLLPAGTKTVKAGAPILYYRANTASKNMTNSFYDKRIYNAYDNYELTKLGSLTVDGRPGKDHPLGEDVDRLYDYDDEGGIRDRKMGNPPWPHRPDSYILISAGADGLYGTSDDIRNF